MIWGCAGTAANDWEIDIDYTAVGGNDAESFDPAAHQRSANLNDTDSTTAFRRMVAELGSAQGIAAADFAVDDFVQFLLSRDRSDAGDTLASPVVVFDFLFRYADA